MNANLPIGYSIARGLPQGELISWDLRKSDELFKLEYGKALVASSREDGNIPVYGTNGQCGWHSSSIFSGPGIILGRKGQGPLGVEYCPDNFWVIDTAYSLKVLEDISLKYCYYMIKYVGLNHLKDGTSNPTLSRDSFGRQLFPIPPIADQEAIAHILGTLDDKIELNRKTNETLEGIAKALFKSWFVDFDPVRAKAEGRPTGLPDEISKLFPDSFEESELGEIPSGWKNLPLGDLYKIGKGGVWGDDSQTTDSHQPFACLRGIDCHSLSSGHLPSVPLRYIKDSHQKGRDLQQYSILVEGSGSFCGRSLLWEKRYEELIGRRVIYSNFCKRLDPLTDLSFSPIAWMGMRRAYERGEISNYRTGSAFPNLDVSGVLMNLKVVIPSIHLAETYETFFSLSKRLDLVRQSKTLSEIRDTLLPRLISGELRVPDAEKMLEEVGV